MRRPWRLLSYLTTRVREKRGPVVDRPDASAGVIRINDDDDGNDDGGKRKGGEGIKFPSARDKIRGVKRAWLNASQPSNTTNDMQISSCTLHIARGSPYSAAYVLHPLNLLHFAWLVRCLVRRAFCNICLLSAETYYSILNC